MSDDEGASNYDNTHRAFLQVFQARSVLTFEEAKPILAAILTAHDDRPTLPNDITQADFNTYIQTLNAAITPLDYEIRRTIPQTSQDRTPIYALVNTASDAMTQMATLLTPDEIAFVIRVLDAMFETYNTSSREVMAVKSIDAINLARAPRSRDSNANGTQGTQGAGVGAGLTLKSAEEVLGTMVAQGYFEKSRAGFYSLSPRALVELRGYLVDTYNEAPDADGEGGVMRIKSCEACRDIVTVGQRCSNRECACRLHNHCVPSIFRNQTARKCPLCKTDWTGEKKVGELAARGQSRASANTRQSTQTVNNESEEEDEGMEDDEDEDEG